MTVNYQALQFWFSIVQGVLTLLMFLYVRRVARQKANEQRLKKIEDELIQRVKPGDLAKLKTEMNLSCEKHKVSTAHIESRTTELKTELGGLPSQFNELTKSMAALSGQLQNTNGRLEGINRAVDLINEFLINQGGGKRQ